MGVPMAYLKIKCLVVDDEASMVRTISNMLTSPYIPGAWILSKRNLSREEHRRYDKQRIRTGSQARLFPGV